MPSDPTGSPYELTAEDLPASLFLSDEGFVRGVLLLADKFITDGNYSVARSLLQDLLKYRLSGEQAQRAFELVSTIALFSGASVELDGTTCCIPPKIGPLFSVEDRLPRDGQYVLAHRCLANWRDAGDQAGVNWLVAKFKRGLSKEAREALPDFDQRKHTIWSADEEGNNEHPYEWDEFGPDCHFGQDVDYWCPLPIVELKG